MGTQATPCAFHKAVGVYPPGPALQLHQNMKFESRNFNLRRRGDSCQRQETSGCPCARRGKRFEELNLISLVDVSDLDLPPGKRKPDWNDATCLFRDGHISDDRVQNWR
jgi:hypothetical protein